MKELTNFKSMIKTFSITKGIFYANFPGHAHARNCYELHYVTDGAGELITNEKIYRLRKNTIYVTGPNKYHMQKTDPEKNMHEYCLYFELEFLPDDLFFNIFLNHNFWIGRSNRKLKKLFEEIYTLMQTNTMFHNKQATLLIYLLMLEFAQLYEPQILSLTNKANNSISNDTLTIDWLFLYNINNLTLQVLADSLGLSQRQTQRKLLENYGMTFQEKKKEAQLERAKILLSNGTSPLQEIVDECGFYSSSALCNFFKKHTGMTPTEYRKHYCRN